MIRKLIFYIRLILANDWNKADIYQRYLGVKFGEKVRIPHFANFGSEPYLIEIGNNVTLTRGVTFITHDGGVAVFRDKYPGMNVYGRIKIGNNVFIGVHTIILPGVTIGNNVVIGAGSLVNKDIPDNVVAAGVPAKIIKSILDYQESSLQKACFLSSVDRNERKEKIIKNADDNALTISVK